MSSTTPFRSTPFRSTPFTPRSPSCSPPRSRTIPDTPCKPPPGLTDRVPGRVQTNAIFSYVDAVNAACREATTTIPSQTPKKVSYIHDAVATSRNNKYHCKVCADSGKPASVVSSHNVKSINGTVTCPTLLAMNCRYCKLPGHTVKFCATLIKHNAANNATNANNSYRKPTTTSFKNDCKNKFIAFCDSDDEEVVATTASESIIHNIVKSVKPVKPVKNKPTNITSKWVAAEFEDSSDEEEEDA